MHWTITERKGGMAVSYATAGATVTYRPGRPQGSAGLRGARWVATVGHEQYAALTLEGAQRWAEEVLQTVNLT